VPSSPVSRALNKRSSVNVEINTEANVAPKNACLAPTPTIIMGGAIMNVRATVHPAKRRPLPFSPSRTRAAVR
jgi:hypothetical protein